MYNCPLLWPPSVTAAAHSTPLSSSSLLPLLPCCPFRRLSGRAGKAFFLDLQAFLSRETTWSPCVSSGQCLSRKLLLDGAKAWWIHSPLLKGHEIIRPLRQPSVWEEDPLTQNALLRRWPADLGGIPCSAGCPATVVHCLGWFCCHQTWPAVGLGSAVHVGSVVSSG